MSLRDEIAKRLFDRVGYTDEFLTPDIYHAEADAILALVRTALLSEAATKAATKAICNGFVPEIRDHSDNLYRAALAAALDAAIGETK